jgi:hypothetical protein
MFFGKDVGSIVKMGLSEAGTDINLITYVAAVLMVVWLVSVPVYFAAWLLAWPLRWFRSKSVALSSSAILSPEVISAIQKAAADQTRTATAKQGAPETLITDAAPNQQRAGANLQQRKK